MIQDAVPRAPLSEDHAQWLREVDGALPVRAQFVLSGNVRDVHLLPPSDKHRPNAPFRRLSTVEALWDLLSGCGYECLFVHDQIDHLRVYPGTPEAEAAAREVVDPHDLGPEITLERLGGVVRAIAGAGRRVALVLDYASRLSVNAANLEDEEHRFLVACEKASHQATPRFIPGPRPGPLYNPVFWIVSSERDLPAWLLLNNEGIKSVTLAMPDLDRRLQLATMLVPSLRGACREPDGAVDQEVVARAAQRFADQSESMTLRSMLEISRLAIERRLAVSEIDDAVRAYRVGMLDNPWKRPAVRDRIRKADVELGQYVLGQQHAIRRAADVLVRSATGLTAAHSSGHASRPRGILFFAGPTGVGKTELAKAVTRLVFGNEDAYARFDMSEYSAEHSEARLVGAPPGYVGHDAGGQLTNAVRRKPFSLVLFDEIEKAHPRILDKFLQILEDGRLTDGSGSTVHFSETLLVFTSNLGIYTEDESGKRVLNVSVDTPRAELERKVQQAISFHFSVKLNRPELLNRMGDNIVVFDFIRPEVARDLVELYLRNVTRRVVKELRVELIVDPAVRELLTQRATADLSFGGRGIGSVLERVYVNPLARELFLRSPEPGSRLTVVGLDEEDDVVSVGLA